MQKPQRILEVGCAIGYSSILFATTCEGNVDITTCERNPVMIERAKENIKRAGFENNIRLETIGDFMGLMIMLIKANIVLIDGEREEDDEYKPETVSFKINPLITKFFKANAGDTEYNADDVLCRLKQENLLKDILRWEKINYGYEKCAAKYSDTPDKETLNVLDSLKETKEAIELELQRSNVMLGSKNGITVKISSDI